MKSYEVQWLNRFKNSIPVLSTEANIKVLFVLSRHTFSPTDIGISVGEKEGFLLSARLSVALSLSISFLPEFHSE